MPPLLLLLLQDEDETEEEEEEESGDEAVAQDWNTLQLMPVRGGREGVRGRGWIEE